MATFDFDRLTTYTACKMHGIWQGRAIALCSRKSTHALSATVASVAPTIRNSIVLAVARSAMLVVSSRPRLSSFCRGTGFLTLQNRPVPPRLNVGWLGHDRRRNARTRSLILYHRQCCRKTALGRSFCLAAHLSLRTRASLRCSAVTAIAAPVTAIAAPITMRASVAPRLPGAMQLIQVPMIGGASWPRALLCLPSGRIMSREPPLKGGAILLGYVSRAGPWPGHGSRRRPSPLPRRDRAHDLGSGISRNDAVGF